MANKTEQKEEISKRKKRPIHAVNTKLLPLKCLIFIFYGGMAALYPFLTIHMKSLGLTITETAMVYGLLPILCFVGPAVAGWAADRLGNYKIILVSAIFINIFLHTLLFFAVPLFEVTEVPETLATRSVSLSLPCQRAAEKRTDPWSIEDFLTIADAADLRCNLTDGNQTENILNSLKSARCQSDCRTKNDTSGSSTVCRADPACHQPLADLFSYLGLPDGKIQNSNSTKNFFFQNDEPIHAECLQSNKKNCLVNCSLEEAVSLTCFRQVTKGNRQMTFWLYFTFRILASIALAAVFPLLDAATIQMTIDFHGDIGLQRMYSLLAMCIWAPVAGVMIDQLGIGFAPAFYLYDGLHVIAAILAIFMSLNVKLPAEDIWKNVGVLLRNPKVVVFIFVVFFIGTAWGLLDSFLFWFMEEDLQSPKWLLGLTNTVGGLCGIPVVAGATWIIKRTGHTNILIFSMFVYGARYIGYSYIYDAYYVLPLEGLEAFTNALMWVTATIYASKIAPAYLATLQGIVGGMHYGIGRGAGSLIGGLMIGAVGTRQAWRIFGYICFGCGFLYATLQYFWLRKIRMPSNETALSKTTEASQSMNIGLAERELKPMGEEEEEMLHEMALMNVVRATSAAALSGSMYNLRKNDEPVTNKKDQPEEDNLADEEEVFGYDEQDPVWDDPQVRRSM